MELVVSVCPSICVRSPAFTVWPTNLSFGIGVDLDRGQTGTSKVKVKCVAHIAVDIKGSACRVQKMAIWPLPVREICLCVCNCVAYAVNFADAVDQL